MKFSQEQRLSIEHNASHLLVSATAGAGKTTVMTERIFERLRSGAIEPSELLVMTFSEKAAEQMGERIERRLTRALKEADDKAFYESLLNRLPDASISTIHAFCNRLVAEFLSDLVDDEGVPFLEPGYQVVDPDQGAGLLREATEATLEDLYILASQYRHGELPTSNEPVPTKISYISADSAPFSLAEPISYGEWLESFLTMTAAYAPGYSDEHLFGTLSSIVHQLRSLPDYEAWLRAQFADALNASSFNDQPHIKKIRKTVETLASGAMRDIVEAIQHPYMDIARAPKAAKTVAAIVDPLVHAASVFRDLPAALDPANDEWWDDVKAIGERLIVLKLPNRRFNSKDGHIQESFFALLKRHIVPLMHVIGGAFSGTTLLNECAIGLEPVFVRTRAEQLADEARSRPLLMRLMETALLVDRRYRALKLRYNMVDFADFEHYALRLLGQQEVVSTLCARYKDIYLDEYQDTSSIQEAVIERLGVRCSFMVGDVKQSIYRFRHANPSLFITRADNYRLVRPKEKLAEERAGDLLLLNTNYRSRAAILDAINDIFSVLMQDAAGEIVYDKTHWLNAGRHDDAKENAVSLNLVLTNAPDDEGEETDPLPATFKAIDYEAFHASRQIRALLATGRAPAEIVILARNHTICAHYVRVLKAAGIPVYGADNEALFSTAELTLLERLFQLLVNAQQDIPLASVMLSALAESPFTESELLTIRNDAPAALTFHEAVYARAKGDDMLAQKIARFVERMARWRRIADRFSVYDLLQQILAETRLRTYVAALPLGPGRVAYLDRFSAWLKKSEPADMRALLSVFAEMKSRQATLKDTSLDLPEKNAVRVMTMHTSKGLEFPIVFVVGLGKRLNRGRFEPFQISETYGVTTDYVDSASGMTYKSLRHRFHVAEHRAEQMQEELRLLYVALTRAEEGLYLFASGEALDNVQKNACDLFSDLDPRRVNFERQQNTSTYLSLILAALRQKYRAALDLWLAGDEAAVDAGSVRLHLTLGEALSADAQVTPEVSLAPLVIDPNDSRVARIAQLMDDTIPNEVLANAPSKMTVSELKREMDQRLIEEASLDGDILIPPEARDMAFLVNRPDQESRDLAKHLGTALHTVFQFLDIERLRQKPSEETYQQLIAEMVSLERLSEDDKALVLPFCEEAITFACSSLADRIIAKGTKVYREMPFTLAVPTPGMAGEITLVQGMIDLWYVLPDGRAGLVDFKSDQMREKSEAALLARYAKRYQVQLDYYSAAIEKAIGNDVHWKQIWAIRQGVELTLD